MRTYIVVAVFHQEGDPLALGAVSASVLLQLVLGRGNVIHQLSIGEGASGQRMHHGCALRIVFLDGLEDGQAGQCRCHPHHVDRSGAGERVKGGRGGQGDAVACESASEEVARPHGEWDGPRVCGSGAGSKAVGFGCENARVLPDLLYCDLGAWQTVWVFESRCKVARIAIDGGRSS